MTGLSVPWILVVVERIDDVAEGIKQFQLVDAAGNHLPPFKPGSHVDVRFPDGVIRQYSLCDGPERDLSAYTIAVRLMEQSRGGSLAMHGLRRGQLLAISEPRNSFPLHPGGAHSVLVAGGIGLTPLLSMARHLRAEARSFELHQFARSPAHAMLTESGEGGRGYCGMSRIEVRAQLGSIVRNAPTGSRFYVCGPEGFMDALIAAAAQWTPNAVVTLERFEAAIQAAESQSSFIVRLARSGFEVQVPAGRSILHVLAEHGVAAPYACEAGMCGTCVTTVLEGIPEHHDQFLSEEEKAAGRSLCICVSRSSTAELILDI